ncbi:hypothetical protein [Chengkuizengella axinellae]|uniref:Uncharacterized protein n=1 Tax=Chengkuizengella axinellae TaxID=3064388 RepID=A0ABT9J0I3_9BACL|nr:hypothetical protein [Chengkuizengella sp. 2205SS18-9]MDP5275125.1 hypothetical protein [Chengkuizengella sp. 2205SS18-9]
MISIFVNKMKPTSYDYSEWMEERYNVKCWKHYNDKCSVFDFELEENGETKSITFQTAKSSYKSGIFVLEMSSKYRSYDDRKYKLDISVKGFLGKIYIMEEDNGLQK